MALHYDKKIAIKINYDIQTNYFMSQVIKRLTGALSFKDLPFGTSERLLEMFDVKLMDGDRCVHSSLMFNPLHADVPTAE